MVSAAPLAQPYHASTLLDHLRIQSAGLSIQGFGTLVTLWLGDLLRLPVLDPAAGFTAGAAGYIALMTLVGYVAGGLLRRLWRDGCRTRIVLAGLWLLSTAFGVYIGSGLWQTADALNAEHCEGRTVRQVIYHAPGQPSAYHFYLGDAGQFMRDYRAFAGCDVVQAHGEALLWIMTPGWVSLSSDGGRAWHTWRPPRGSIESVEFDGLQHGTLVVRLGPGTIARYHSSDGGASWQPEAY